MQKIKGEHFCSPFILCICLSYTNAAVMIAIEYTSIALQPRERSLTGAFNPRRIGP